jgi:hypothetical protein
VQLTNVEEAVLRAIAAKYLEREMVFYEDAMILGLEDKEVLRTLLKLQTLGLIRLDYRDQTALRQRLLNNILPLGTAFLYLEGRLKPLPPGHVEVTVQLDPEAAAQLCDAVAWIYTGQTDVAEAVQTVAHELRQPPKANRAELVQAAIATLTLAAESAPMIKTVLLPVLGKLFG